MEGSWSAGSPVNICLIPSFAEIHGNGAGLMAFKRRENGIAILLPVFPEQYAVVASSHLFRGYEISQ